MRPDSDAEEALVRQMRALERRHRRLVAFTVLLAAVLVWSEMVPRARVESETFVLLDESGRQRGIWRVRDDAPALILADSEGGWRAIVEAGPDGGRMRLNGPGRGTFAMLATLGDRPRLEVHDSGGGTVVASVADGRPLVEVANEERGRRNRLRPRDRSGPRERP